MACSAAAVVVHSLEGNCNVVVLAVGPGAKEAYWCIRRKRIGRAKISAETATIQISRADLPGLLTH